MKFIATTSNKIDTIPIKSGQLIFSRNDRVIYLDSEAGRTSFQQIITVATEEARLNLKSPITGFYFVESSKAFWRYTEDGIWEQITDASMKKQVVFTDKNSILPEIGEKDILYINNNKFYQWDNNQNDYTEINSLTWESIS